MFTELTIFRATDPEIVAPIHSFFLDAKRSAEGVEEFMVAVNVHYPLASGVRIPHFIEGVLVGISAPDHPLAYMDGWERSTSFDGWLPDPRTAVGAAWERMLDAITGTPDPIELDQLNHPSFVGTTQGGHIHPLLTLSEPHEEPAVFIAWPARGIVRAAILHRLTELPNGAAWQEMRRSDFFSRIEAIEAWSTPVPFAMGAEA